MQLPNAVVVLTLAAAFGAGVSAQSQPAAGGTFTDIYHVSFSKAAPGQATALGEALSVPDKTAPMPDHFVVLRHQEGDDWDYVVIQHLGPKATIDAAPGPLPAASPLRAWHNDTFVGGPSWPEFTKAMGIGGKPGAVYTVSVHRPVAGQREQLLKALSAPPAGKKVQTGDLLFQHLEGADWTFLAVTRYASWQDFAADRSGAASATGPGSWGDIRQYSAFHRDTIADRTYPK